MSGRAVFFLTSAGYEPAWQATSMALTAVAMGDEVILVAAFDVLRAIAKGTWGKPRTSKERASAKRGKTLGAATPVAMLEEARSLGARLIACDTTVKLCGLDPERLEHSRELDEVTGLPSIWKLTEGAKVLTF